MEVINDFFVTACLGIVLSFLVAKLVSMAMAGDHAQSESQIKSVGEGIAVEEICSVERLQVQSSPTERKVGFLVPEVVDSVNKFSPVQVESNVEIESHCGEIKVEFDAVELPVQSSEADYGEDMVSKDVNATEESMEEKATEFPGSNVTSEEFDIEEIGEANFDNSAKQGNTESIEEIITESSTKKETAVQYEESKVVEEEVGEANLDDSVKLRNTEPIEEIGVEPSTKGEIPVQYEESEAVDSDVKERDEEREVTPDFEEDDDWEGIERSELEKTFMSASEFVARDDKGELLASIGSGVQMQLYGLHKVATEGPCREPQPMALMLSSRAKWNAWQKLGNMSPEVAMEQYIALLSDKVPGWMEDNTDENIEQELTKSDCTGIAFSTSLSQQQSPKAESEHIPCRELEQQSNPPNCSLPLKSDLEDNILSADQIHKLETCGNYSVHARRVEELCITDKDENFSRKCQHFGGGWGFSPVTAAAVMDENC